MLMGFPILKVKMENGGVNSPLILTKSSGLNLKIKRIAKIKRINKLAHFET